MANNTTSTIQRLGKSKNIFKCLEVMKQKYLRNTCFMTLWNKHGKQTNEWRDNAIPRVALLLTIKSSVKTDQIMKTLQK